MKKIFLLFTVLIIALTSCNRNDSHIVLAQGPNTEQGGAIIDFNTDGVTGKKFDDTHLYGFDVSGKMIMHKYYPTQKELSNNMLQIKKGAYTFIAVFNVGEAFTPKTKSDTIENVTMAQVMSYIKYVETSYPDMLTGMISSTIATGNIERIEIKLADKSDGIATVSTIITATITLPDAEFTEYQKARTKATAEYNLRGVVEFYRKEALVSRTTAILAPTGAEGKYTLTAQVPDGEYDVALWVDYTKEGSKEDKWYDTKSLQAIKLLHTEKTYTAGSDSREVFYYTGKLTATGGKMVAAFTAERPQAKYTIIANDIARYRELMAVNPDKYVPLSELSVSMLYEGYLPCGFNVLTGKPNDSETGFKSNKNPLPAVGAIDREVQIGSDYVFVNGTESSVTVTVVVTDKFDRTLSRVSGVKVDYKRNMLTTVRGDFLTSGVINPGINIDTNWDGIHNVEF